MAFEKNKKDMKNSQYKKEQPEPVPVNMQFRGCHQSVLNFCQ
jgi:hypothetical protein